jgi:hypothetical protein
MVAGYSDMRNRMPMGAKNEITDTLPLCLDALRRRFQGRGMLKSVQSGAHSQNAAVMHARAIAPGAYADYGIRHAVSDRFRTGSYNGERYMTSADFVRYYAEHRVKMRPDADMPHMAVVRDPAKRVPSPAPKKSILAPAEEESRRLVGKIASKLPASFRDKHPAAAERAAEVHTWLTADTIREAPAAKKQRFPVSVASAILVVMISLSLVVGGTVMYSNANSEYKAASDALEAVKAEELSLENSLAVKLDLVEAEDYARNTLGMVDRSYIGGEYLNAAQEESIEVYTEEKPSFGLSTLLSALGFGG